jgi:hypothetical protein
MPFGSHSSEGEFINSIRGVQRQDEQLRWGSQSWYILGGGLGAEVRSRI